MDQKSLHLYIKQRPVTKNDCQSFGQLFLYVLAQTADVYIAKHKNRHQI